MKKFGLYICFIFWVICTIIFTLSIVGWVMIIRNNQGYITEGENRRTVWMGIGYEILEKL